MSDISKAPIRLSAWRMPNAEGQPLYVASVGGDMGLVVDGAQLITTVIEAPDILRCIAMADVLLLAMDAFDGVAAPVSHLIPVAGMMGVVRVLVTITDLGQGPEGEGSFLRSQHAVLELGEAWRLGGLDVLPSCSAAIGMAVPAWYSGRNLIDCLRACEPWPLEGQALRVQVHAPGREGSDVQCDVLAGVVRSGNMLRAMPSGCHVHVKTLFGEEGALGAARRGARVGMRLTENVDLVAGELLVAADAPPQQTDQFEAQLLWLSPRPLVPGRAYRLCLAGREVAATVTTIKFRRDLSNGAHLAARTLEQDNVATVNISTKEMVVFEPYPESRILGSFSLHDVSGEWLGVGTVDFALRRASNIHWQALELNKQARARIKSQAPRCVWLTGLSGSGKSTIANLLEKRLHALGRHTYVLDGDNVRHGLNRDLGFTEADRVENIRRVGEMAKLMVDAGLIVIVSFISPFASERQMARSLFDEGEFVEVFVDTPLEECERRDVKGLYAKARSGLLQNFTGIDSAYEAPSSPDVHIQAGMLSASACVDIICEWLK